NLWASGYDVDGTDQTSLGQFSGRVQQTYKHSVPRFFVPEHGTMFTLALVRFPPTATKEIQYLNARSEERFSRNAETDLVCRLLLEKKSYRRMHRRRTSEQRPMSAASNPALVRSHASLRPST